MRKFSLGLVVIGAFLIVAGPMIRQYSYPRLATAPVNQRSTTYLQAKDATVFDVATLKPTTTDLNIVAKTVGDTGATKSCPGAVSYVTSTSVTTDGGAKMISRQVERTTMDAISGMPASRCDGDFLSTTQGVEEPVQHHGLTQKFPFNTERHGYSFWDSTVGKAYTATFVGATTYRGVSVYEFKQTVPEQQAGTLEVPGSMAGQRTDAVVEAQKMYSNERTFWVEPETGLIVDRREKSLSYLQYDGKRGVTLNSSTVSYAPKTLKDNVENLAAKGPSLHAMRVTIPLGAMGIGLVLLIVGVILSTRHRPKATAAPVSERELVGAS